MEDKDFDQEIRKKLASVKADYSPDAWERFKGLVPVPWYISFFKNYGGWIFGGISTVALLFTLYSKNEKSFDNKTTLVQEPIVNVITDTLYQKQTDTVYKYVYVTQFRDRLLSPKEDDFARNSGKENLQNLLVNEKTEDKNTEPLKGVLEESLTKSEQSKKEEESKNEGAIEEITKEEVAKDEVVEEKVAKKEHTPLDSTVIAQEEDKIKKKKSDFWKKLNIRPGVELDYAGNRAFSFGPWQRFFLKIDLVLPRVFPYPEDLWISFRNPMSLIRRPVKILATNTLLKKA